MTKLEQYEAYFEDIARKFVPISHTDAEQRFFKMTYAQVLSGIRKTANVKEYCLFLMSFEPSVAATNTRQYRTEIRGAFEILKEPSLRDDLAKPAIMGEAHQHCEEIYAKMMKDHKDRTFPLGFLSEDDVDFYPVESDFDKRIGYGCAFRYHVGFAPVNIINPSNWND